MKLAEWCKQLSRVTEFSIRTEQPLQILFLTYSSFEYVLFYQFYAKITTFFFIKKCSFRLLSYTLTSKCLEETNVKMMSRCQKWRQNHHTDIMHKSCLTPPHVRWHFLDPVVFKEIPLGYARIGGLSLSLHFFIYLTFLYHLFWRQLGIIAVLLTGPLNIKSYYFVPFIIAFCDLSRFTREIIHTVEQIGRIFCDN